MDTSQRCDVDKSSSVSGGRPQFGTTERVKKWGHTIHSIGRKWQCEFLPDFDALSKNFGISLEVEVKELLAQGRVPSYQLHGFTSSANSRILDILRPAIISN